MAKDKNFEAAQEPSEDVQIADAAPAEVAAAQPEAPTAEIGNRVSLRAVFGGPMVNPLNEDTFVGEPSKPVTIDAWLKVQIEAGKLVIVE